jgi:hypothetical protein
MISYFSTLIINYCGYSVKKRKRREKRIILGGLFSSSSYLCPFLYVCGVVFWVKLSTDGAAEFKFNKTVICKRRKINLTFRSSQKLRQKNNLFFGIMTSGSYFFVMLCCVLSLPLSHTVRELIYQLNLIYCCQFALPLLFFGAAKAGLVISGGETSKLHVEEERVQKGINI